MKYKTGDQRFSTKKIYSNPLTYYPCILYYLKSWISKYYRFSIYCGLLTNFEKFYLNFQLVLPFILNSKNKIISFYIYIKVLELRTLPVWNCFWHREKVRKHHLRHNLLIDEKRRRLPCKQSWCCDPWTDAILQFLSRYTCWNFKATRACSE